MEKTPILELNEINYVILIEYFILGRQFLMEISQNAESVIKNHAKLLFQRLLPALGGSSGAPSSE